MGEIFSQVSRFYDPFLKGITFGFIDRWQKRMLSLIENEGSRLDVGTGTGEVLIKSQNAGLKVGIDLSLGMLKEAKRKCPQCKLLLADAENMPFKENSFRSITLSLVYRHLESRESFLKEARRVLEREGKVAILDINRFWGTSFLAFLLKYPLRVLGVALFGKEKWDFFIHSLEEAPTLSVVKKELEKEGFRIEREERRFFNLVYVLVAQKP